MVPEKKKKRLKENVDHPTIYIFQRGLQIMVVECIGVEFQSCCSQSGATSAYNTCLEREVGRTTLCMEQKILLHQLGLTSVSWQWELKAKYSQPAEDCHADGPLGGETVPPRRLPRCLPPSITCLAHQITLNLPKRDAKNSKIFHSFTWNRFPSVRVLKKKSI